MTELRKHENKKWQETQAVLHRENMNEQNTHYERKTSKLSVYRRNGSPPKWAGVQHGEYQ